MVEEQPGEFLTNQALLVSFVQVVSLQKTRAICCLARTGIDAMMEQIRPDTVAGYPTPALKRVAVSVDNRDHGAGNCGGCGWFEVEAVKMMPSLGRDGGHSLPARGRFPEGN